MAARCPRSPGSTPPWPHVEVDGRGGWSEQGPLGVLPVDDCSAGDDNDDADDHTPQRDVGVRHVVAVVPPVLGRDPVVGLLDVGGDLGLQRVGQVHKLLVPW